LPVGKKQPPERLILVLDIPPRTAPRHSGATGCPILMKMMQQSFDALAFAVDIGPEQTVRF
jgi:hypothetical protein